MFRSILALSVRSLREDTRALGPHLFRLLFALFIAATLIFAHQQSAIYGAPGLRFFSNLCWLNFCFITVGGVSIFATPITEEKEEATLGLLRMAGINPLGLLLGKSSTRLFAAALILTIQFPFTLLAITLGGVLWHQIVAAYLSLLAYLIFVAQVGLLCSIICARSSAASGLSGILQGMFLGFPYYLEKLFSSLARDWGLPIFRPLASLSGELTNASIWHTLTEILSTGFQGDLVLFQTWTNLVAAAGLFVISWLSFDFFTRDHLTSVPARGALFRWRSKDRSGARPATVLPAARRWFSPGRTWMLPHLWKEFHFLAGGFPMIVGKLAGYLALSLIVTVFFLMTGTPEHPVEVFAKCTWALALFLGLAELALHLSRIFREELRWQTFSTLLMLPGGLLGLTGSKIAGILLSWFPVVFWLAVGIFLDAREVGWFLREGFDDVPTLMVFFVLHYLVFLHLVVWFSLIMKWGALPLAFVIAYVLFWPTLIGCASTMRMGQTEANFLFFTLDLFALFFCAALQGAIWLQLHLLSERA